MKLKIVLGEEKLKLELIDKKKVIDSLETKEKFNLSKSILINIDRLLKRNNISKTSVKEISYDCNIPEFYTSGRIAKSIEKSFNFALKNK